jgi:methylglyoxal synthase
MLSEPLGGDVQIAARVAEAKIKVVLFFKNPNFSHPRKTDINMLNRVCDVHNIPLATNEATAQMLLNAIWGKQPFCYTCFNKKIRIDTCNRSKSKE